MLLAIDTSGPTLSLGLFDAARARASTVEEIGRGHAERLVPAIAGLLDGSGVKPSALERIAVVVGPGSFMGLRVGIACARSMALGLGIEAVGVSRMRALARPHGAVHVVLDARRGAVFEQAFDAANEPTSPLRATAIEDFTADAVRIGGSGAALVGHDAVFARDVPALADVAALALVEPLAPRPLYGRGADAKPQRPPILSSAAQR